MANQFTRYAFNEMNLFDVVSDIRTIDLNDIQPIAKDLINDRKNYQSVKSSIEIISQITLLLNYKIKGESML